MWEVVLYDPMLEKCPLRQKPRSAQKVGYNVAVISEIGLRRAMRWGESTGNSGSVSVDSVSGQAAMVRHPGGKHLWADMKLVR